MSLDISLKLLTGLPIKVENFGEVQPLTIKEIIDYGYSDYSQSLNLFLLSKDSLRDTVLKDVTDEELDGISNLELIIFMSTDEVIEDFEKSCKFFFRCQNAYVDKEDFCIYLKYSEDNFKVIDRNNYDSIIDVIKLQNYLDSVSDEEDINNNESEETRKFKEKMKKLQKERDRVKRKRDNEEDDEDNTVTIYEIISSLSTKSNINDIDILNLTIYQLYTKFKRLELITQYDLNVQSMLAGASGVKLKHWSTRLK